MTGDVALVRSVPGSFRHAERSDEDRALEVDLARRQHDSYVAVLESAGYTIDRIPADESHPDCVFIEDTAVVVGSVAVIARSGAVSRRGEAGPVAERLARRYEVRHIGPPGTLDGGDVIVGDGSILIGRSRRTNTEGIDQFAAIAASLGLDLNIVEVREGLHLKSVVLPLDGETMLVTPGAVDVTALGELHILHEPDAERHRSSALPLRDGRLMVTEGTPATAALLDASGYDVVPVDVSELLAADGGLTCLSILVSALPVAPDSRENGSR